MVELKQIPGGNSRLSDIQISMLRLFDQGISETDTLKLRRILMDYFDKELQSELEKVLEKKQYSEDDYHKMLSDDNFMIKWCVLL